MGVVNQVIGSWSLNFLSEAGGFIASNFLVQAGLLVVAGWSLLHIIFRWLPLWRFYKKKTGQLPAIRQLPDKEHDNSPEAKLLQAEVNETAKVLDQEASLLHRSMVIAICGDWGAGKTITANKLAQALGVKKRRMHHIYYFPLLPFGNITESLNSILGILARGLKFTAKLKVKKELQEVLINATPANDIQTGFSFLGFSLSKKMVSRLRSQGPYYSQELRKKFQDFTQDEKRLVIIIDDLDRMAPEEVVMIIRLVERFSDIPGIIFILPFNREAVVESIKHYLRLDDRQARVYLRKFIDNSIQIKLKSQNLRTSFEGAFNKQKIKGLRRLYNYGLSRVAWSILVHILLLEEFRDEIHKPTNDTGGRYINCENFLDVNSSYLTHIHQLCSSWEQYAGNTFFIYSDLPSSGIAEEDWRTLKQRFTYLGHLVKEDARKSVQDIKDPSVFPFEQYTGQLNSLVKPDTITKQVCTNVTAGKCDCQPKHKGTLLSKVIIPGIRDNTTSEPLLTGAYSRRDMEQLGALIARGYYASPENEGDPSNQGMSKQDIAAKRLSAIIKEKFEEFR